VFQFEKRDLLLWRLRAISLLQELPTEATFDVKVAMVASWSRGDFDDDAVLNVQCESKANTTRRADHVHEFTPS